MQALACSSAYGAPPQAKSAPDDGRSIKRIVHHFDFNERGEGNLEELPRYWTPLRGEQFPRFIRGGFDDAVGRTAPPSFHIESVGRNVVFQYDGPEIPVRPESEYRIEGFVRTSEMSAARVCVSAHFLDAKRQALLATSRRTPYIAQQPNGEWAAFELQLPAAPEGAEYLGLAVWILQDATWNVDQQGLRVSLVDVNAAAWFDDITVFRLPRVEITTRAPGEILNDEGDAALWVILADSLDQQVTAELAVVAADGAVLLKRQLQSDKGAALTSRVELPGLTPGLYHARVEVIDRGKIIVTRSLRFLKLGALGPAADAQARAFGIVIDPEDRADLRSEAAMLKNHAARSVKLPIWPEMQWLDTGDGDRRVLEQYYHQLADNQFLLTGALCGPLSKPRDDSRNAENALISLLSGDRAAWEPQIATVAASAAGVFRWWQIGADGPSVLDHAGLKEASTQLRSALREYITVPRLAMPVSANDELAGIALPAEQVTVSVQDAGGLWDLADRLKTLKDNGYEEVCVYVPPLSPRRFAREARLAEWARRILEVRHAGADVVFVPQPWEGRATAQGMIVEPTEEYLLSRTIGGILGDAKPGPVLAVADHVRCLTFRNAGHAVVALWDEAPPKGGRTVAIQLGSADRQVDMWGRSIALRRDYNGRQVVAITAMPVLIDHADPSVIDIASSFTMDPPVIESGAELVRQEIILNCAATTSISGSGVLIPPDGIEAWPRTFSFTACAGEPVRIPIQVRYPHNEPAGHKKFLVQITRVAPAYYFEIPLMVEVRMSDIEVSGRATIERGDLLLRQTLHNQSQNVVSFRSIADVPGRQRQYRPVSNLAPGETQTIEYRFRDAENLIGRRVNLALRELNDGPRQHNLQLVVP